MAIFASTTTSGYSDPMKAMTIKALEARQKDMLAQQAAQSSQMFTPENTQTPVQGLAQVANVAVDAMRSNRLDQAAAAKRDEFSKVMAGVDWEKGPTAQQIAGMGSADPETMRQVLSTMAENRRNAANNATTERGQTLTLQGVQGGHAVTREGQVSTAETAKAGQQVTRELGNQSDATARAGQQLQLDLADKAAKSRREEAIAEREWKSAEQRLAEAQASGTEAQRIAAQKDRDEKQQRHELARDNANNAAKLVDSREDRGAQAERQRTQIQATSDLADKQFGYSKETKASDQAFTAAESALDRASKSGDRQAQIAAAADLAEKGRAHQTQMAKDEQSHQERLANHKIEAATLAAKTTPDYIKATTEAKDTYANHLLSVEKLKEARALAPKINTGPWQALQTGTALASGGRIGDRASAEATTRFNSIMDEQAILAMSKTLKGQSTDFEMKEFKKVFNNPNASPQDRLAALDKLIAKADTDLVSHREALKSYTGSGDSAARIETGVRGGGGGGGRPLQDAQDAINRGAPLDQVAARLKAAGLDPSGLKPKGP